MPLLPPGLFAAAGVKVAVVQRTEGHGVGVRHLATHGAGLGEPHMMSLDRDPATDEAGLAGNKPQVVAVADPPRLGVGEDTLVDERTFPVAVSLLLRLGHPRWGCDWMVGFVHYDTDLTA